MKDDNIVLAVLGGIVVKYPPLENRRTVEAARSSTTPLTSVAFEIIVSSDAASLKVRVERERVGSGRTLCLCHCVSVAALKKLDFSSLNRLLCI